MTIQYRDFLSKVDGAQEYERYISGLCPFHSDTSPSLLIFKDGWFRCLACNVNGSWKTLWNKLNGSSFVVHREEHTNWSGPRVHPLDAEEVCYQAHIDLMNYPSFGWYLEMRGIESMIEPCELGYYKGWYTIPVRDEEGNFVHAVYRSAPHVQDATKIRYWCKGKPRMYVPDWNLFNRKDYIVVVFGIFDAITLAMLRHPVATSSHGKDSFQAEWISKYYKNVYIIPDEGEYTTALKLSKGFDWRGNIIRIDYPRGMDDPASFAKERRLDELNEILVSNIKEVQA